MSDWSAGDCVDHAITQSDLLDQLVTVEDGFIILKINENESYEVCIAHINSAEDILKFLLQILEKKWVTRHLVNRFLSLACRESGIKLYHEDGHHAVSSGVGR